eukprot:6484708-Amphidinium_carterae.1
MLLDGAQDSASPITVLGSEPYSDVSTEAHKDVWGDTGSSFHPGKPRSKSNLQCSSRIPLLAV